MLIFAIQCFDPVGWWHKGHWPVQRTAPAINQLSWLDKDHFSGLSLRNDNDVDDVCLVASEEQW